MSVYKPYRSKRVVLAKPLEHAGTHFDPRTGQKQQFQTGDYLVNDDGKQRIVGRESFEKEYEAAE